MVSGFILAFSLVALIRFGVLYCRGILLRTAELPVSEEVRTAARLSGEEITGRDFAALADMHSMTPGGSGGVTLVKAYYRAVQLVGAIGKTQAACAAWAEREMAAGRRSVGGRSVGRRRRGFA